VTVEDFFNSSRDDARDVRPAGTAGRLGRHLGTFKPDRLEITGKNGARFCGLFL
jgi:hypothetical protein